MSSKKPRIQRKNDIIHGNRKKLDTASRIKLPNVHRKRVAISAKRKKTVYITELILTLILFRVSLAPHTEFSPSVIAKKPLDADQRDVITVIGTTARKFLSFISENILLNIPATDDGRYVSKKSDRPLSFIGIYSINDKRSIAKGKREIIRNRAAFAAEEETLSLASLRINERIKQKNGDEISLFFISSSVNYEFPEIFGHIIMYKCFYSINYYFNFTEICLKEKELDVKNFA